MSYLGLKHLFGGLMAVSVVTAFVLPGRSAETHKPAVEALFAPISRPAAAIAGWAHDSFAAPELSADKRASELVKRENELLKNEVSSLSVRIATLEEIEKDRERVGNDIRKLCTPFSVASTDSGPRASLGIQGSSLQGLRDGMAALYAGGIVGRVERAGLVGARVQLVTDVGFRVRVGFVRFDGARFVRLRPLQTYAEGTGRGAMKIIGLTREDVAGGGLKAGDWVILNEPEWPGYLQGRALGRITAIGPRPDAPLFAQIIVEPSQNLLRLTEVLIVTKEPAVHREITSDEP